MAKASQGVWAIDIGSCSLKAVHLRGGDDGLEVAGFDYIEHSKILSVADVTTAEQEQAIRETLSKFASRNDAGREEIAISIAGQNSFARFVKMPPVERKRIPKIIPLEAVQQIPFDINEVEWDWQEMNNPNSPDIEVGIFAIKNEVIASLMDHFTQENLRVTCVQIAPMSLYNYLIYDRKDVAAAGGKATIVLDMGAENTTLVICTQDSVWQRSIRIGGNTFTEAIADAFKLKFAKAEKLKRTAPMSKYMRQIFTAMKPVYTDLGGEIQRSLGFYSSSSAGRDKGFSKIIALGGGVKLQGLTKYLQQSLSIPVIKPDSFERLKLSPEVSAAKFHENLSDFGVVYGLGVQLLDDAKIETNLLPRRIARAMTWTRKAQIFTMAAAVFLAVSLLSVIWSFKGLQQYNRRSDERRRVQTVISEARQIQSEVDEAKNKIPQLEQQVQKEMDRFKYRDVIPYLQEVLLACFPNKNNTADQAGLFEAFEQGQVEQIISVPRLDRKMMFITRMDIQYAGDLGSAQFPQIAGRGYGSGGYGSGGFGMGLGGPMMPTGPSMGSPIMDPAMGGTGTVGQSTATSGFVVVVEGFSPFKRIDMLLDPPGVGKDQQKWGVITRFENLGTLFPNIPFELFSKKDITNLKIERGFVDPKDTLMPSGIGVLRDVERVPLASAGAASAAFGGYGAAPMGGPGVTKITRELVLFDPMTSEEISKTYDIITAREIAGNPDLSESDLGRIKKTEFNEDKFIERDSWFRIQAKFIWKDAPSASVSPEGMETNQYGY